MGLQKCDKCKSQFKWSKILKSLWKGYKPIQCDNCSSEHKLTFPSRFTVISLTMLPFFIFYFFLSPFDNVIMTFIIGLCIATLGFLLTPYVVHYKKNKN